MSDLVRATSLSDLTVGEPVKVDVAGVPVCLVRTDETTVRAVNDICTHQNVSLAEGELEGDSIECWMHGSCFSLTTGQPSGPPAITPVAVYAVELDGDDVLVDVTTPVNN